MPDELTRRVFRWQLRGTAIAAILAVMPCLAVVSSEAAEDDSPPAGLRAYGRWENGPEE